MTAKSGTEPAATKSVKADARKTKGPLTSFSRLTRSNAFWITVSFSFFVHAALLFARTSPTVAAGLLTKDVAPNKPYATFEEFYPFYLSQHENPTSRLLHFMGTTIIFISGILDPSLVLCLGVALYAGLGVFEFTRGYNHGIIEAVVMVLILQINCFVASKSVSKGLFIMLCGYGFAWVGHFMFEGNRPATFIYPSFSLLGDFTLWYEIVTAERSLASTPSTTSA